MAWFKKVRKPIEPPDQQSRVPEGLWVKCPSCGQVIYNKDLAASLSVCTKCGHHFRLSATERLRSLFDGDLGGARPRTDVHRPAHVHRHQALSQAARRRASRRPASRTPSSRRPARSTGSRPSSPRWSTGSSAAAWASWSARRSRVASSARSRRKLPVIIVSCSGGARMMEGALSLMQMAKISSALARLGARTPAVHLPAHRSDDRRRDGELRDAGRPQHRGAEGAHRLCRPAGDRTDHPAERSPKAFSAASSSSNAACSTSSSIAAS